MLPLSLYIHIPWCILKCPYCDFNSHKRPQHLPEMGYVEALINDLRQDLLTFPAGTISSVFIGGGTPSLFSADAFERLFHQLRQLLPMATDLEVTLEANPGTFEQQRFADYRQLGINRLSLGIQSFNPKHLQVLGRVHNDFQARAAIEAARAAGFDNINLDLMYGLPGQTVEEGLADLQTAVSYQTEHLSWYQLTIEPNTLFYKKKPVLPLEDDLIELEEQGLNLLAETAFQRYEISAFARDEQFCRHNLNYWLFGDYLGIGAGAHGKLTQGGLVQRRRKHRQPTEYLNPEKSWLAATEAVDADNLMFEFMLNTTRLEQPIPYSLFKERTGLELQQLWPFLKAAQAKGLLDLYKEFWQVSSLGRRYTNDLQALFLPEAL